MSDEIKTIGIFDGCVILILVVMTLSLALMGMLHIIDIRSRVEDLESKIESLETKGETDEPT